MMKINKKYILAGLACGFLMISGICYTISYHKYAPSDVLVSSGQPEAKETIKEAQTVLITPRADENAGLDEAAEITAAPAAVLVNSQAETTIYVHICGAVVTPGVYGVAEDARIVDLIELSGGLREEAAGDYINQAQKVTDGQRIYIPTREEVAGLSAAEYAKGSQSTSGGNQNTAEASEEKPDQSSFVNINTAEEEELMSLPGIGQAKADSIIQYRTENGKFKTKEELMNIPGIKEGIFNRISTFITAE